ncbi:MAG: hypothetical protein ACKVOM_10975 [Ferruginibacter sp.]
MNLKPFISLFFAFFFTNLLFSQNNLTLAQLNEKEDSIRNWTIIAQNKEEDSLKTWLLIEELKAQDTITPYIRHYRRYYESRKPIINSEGKDISPVEPDPSHLNVSSFVEYPQPVNLEEVNTIIKEKYYELVNIFNEPLTSYAVKCLVCIDEFGNITEYSILTDLPTLHLTIIQQNINKLKFTPYIAKGIPSKFELEVILTL